MNKDFNKANLEKEMARITREEGKIPSILWVEMALRSEAGSITYCVARHFEAGVEYISECYPNLFIKVWDKPGWKLE